MSITTAKMLMGVINTHILNYCEGDALPEAAECSRQVEDELTKAEARIAELEGQASDMRMLLAAKDERIARLEAQTVTDEPSKERLWQLYTQAEREAGEYWTTWIAFVSGYRAALQEREN